MQFLGLFALAAFVMHGLQHFFKYYDHLILTPQRGQPQFLYCSTYFVYIRFLGIRRPIRMIFKVTIELFLNSKFTKNFKILFYEFLCFLIMS